MHITNHQPTTYNSNAQHSVKNIIFNHTRSDNSTGEVEINKIILLRATCTANVHVYYTMLSLTLLSHVFRVCFSYFKRTLSMKHNCSSYCQESKILTSLNLKPQSGSPDCTMCSIKALLVLEGFRCPVEEWNRSCREFIVLPI